VRFDLAEKKVGLGRSNELLRIQGGRRRKENIEGSWGLSTVHHQGGRMATRGRGGGRKKKIAAGGPLSLKGEPRFSASGFKLREHAAAKKPKRGESQKEKGPFRPGRVR